MVQRVIWREFFAVDRVEIFLFVFAFAVRALYAIVTLRIAGQHGFIAFSDAESFYYQAAVNLLGRHTFSVAAAAPFVPDAYHTILFPLFVSALLALHISLFGIALFQDALAAIGVVLAYRCVLSFTKSFKIALVAAALSAIEPMSIYWAGLLMSDVFFSTLLIISLYFLASERPYWAAAALGLATLTRPIGLYMVPPFLVMILFLELRKGTHLFNALQITFLSLLVAALMAAPWYARNKIVFNTWALSSSGWYLAYNFPVYEYTLAENLPHPSPPDSEGVERFDFKHAALYKQLSLAAISLDPPGFALVYAKRSVYSLVTDRYEYLIHDVIAVKLPKLYDRIPPWVITWALACGRAFWMVTYALALVAVCDVRYRVWWLFYAALLALNILLSGGINPTGTDMSRYMLPLVPFLFAFAGIGAKQLIGFMGWVSGAAHANRSGAQKQA
jgi:4-amino-4-deoxy-L-arabinose transferase-like glycosyltransferase